jgi:hypothetical protein
VTAGRKCADADAEVDSCWLSWILKVIREPLRCSLLLTSSQQLRSSQPTLILDMTIGIIVMSADMIVVVT